MIIRSVLVVLHDFTSAERVLNVGRVLSNDGINPVGGLPKFLRQ